MRMKKKSSAFSVSFAPTLVVVGGRLRIFFFRRKKMYTHSRGYIYIRRRENWMVEVRRHACVQRLRIHCLTGSLEHWGTRSLIICKFSSAKTVSRWQLVYIKFVIREILDHRRRVWWCVNRQLSLIEKYRIRFFAKSQIVNVFGFRIDIATRSMPWLVYSWMRQFFTSIVNFNCSDS